VGVGHVVIFFSRALVILEYEGMRNSALLRPRPSAWLGLGVTGTFPMCL
jgi:hypothetical protein